MALIRRGLKTIFDRSTFTLKRYLNTIELKSNDDRNTTLIIDGKEIKYDWIFLRDSCSCWQCIDQSSQQKLHHTGEIPLDIRPRSNDDVRIVDGNRLEIVWNHALTNERKPLEHRSEFSRQWLEIYGSEQRLTAYRFNENPLITWNRDELKRVDLRVNCDDYLNSDDGFDRVLNLLYKYGLVFIENVYGEFTIEKLVERIGEIRQTFYGRTWDVKNVENAQNIAYTSQSLGLHMDLLYFETPPGLQFLHCLVNNVQGGASLYVDSFRAAEILRQENPKAFNILCQFPVTFHYRNAARHFHFTRPTIVLKDDSIDYINYSPPFQAPFEITNRSNDFREFHQAFRRFREIIEDPSNLLELNFPENRCAIFHNRRILHGRRSFDSNSGQRWLKGCYTDTDYFKDRWRINQEKKTNSH